MRDDGRLDELDRAIVNAVQINPRASWAQVGVVLGVDPTTVVRRWNRVQEAGIAWITAYANPVGAAGVLALVEIDSEGRFLDIAAELADDPECVTIDITSGGRDLLLTVTAPDQDGLTRYVLNRLGSLERIRSVRPHLVVRKVADGRSWRLRHLSEEQVARLASTVSTPAGGLTPERGFSRDERAVLDCLTEDPRMTAVEIAARTAFSQKRVGNLLRALLDARRVALRVDVQRSATGWPVYAWLFLRVPANLTDAVSQQLGKLAELRTVLQVAGPSNVVMAVWLRELADVGRLEAAIAEQLPHVQISDRSVVLRTTKHAGAVLGEDGRRLRTVDMAFLD
ncbi:Lrp/AsnC family transcriptional regulator [Saccharopolyspora sp. WRP15-2]|uniref:Lrp/AsnC family transcriptional regulator n=1 Tax=Saccharopolyspora oryzae TaxID=2997343 RepID=A0ABT4V9T7_9PSEU|nr:Lrp/AsnC family transcriptional regulator [Saccharopolyspora oryzae]MDA3630734.1 Lrp/AsnC family transcriptional regulator [Saccharopolyspora oryzae]